MQTPAGRGGRGRGGRGAGAVAEGSTELTLVLLELNFPIEVCEYFYEVEQITKARSFFVTKRCS